jgi:hypothetical protein
VAYLEFPPDTNHTQMEASTMHFHIYRDKSRAGHVDLVGDGDHPWTIDLVTAVVAIILVVGFVCALASHLIVR